MARSNSIRIIGGEFRGRRLGFPDAPGLRPTADRLRETLFNWLQVEIEGASCLDLFAGSGALGLEALSRGAQTVRFVDQSRAVIRQLEQNVRLLKLQEKAEIVATDGMKLLRKEADRQFDIVFLDPPFARDWLAPACLDLERNGWLQAESWIYLEQDSRQDWPPLPAGWRLHREGRAGQAACKLLRRGILKS